MTLSDITLICIYIPQFPYGHCEPCHTLQHYSIWPSLPLFPTLLHDHKDLCHTFAQSKYLKWLQVASVSFLLPLATSLCCIQAHAIVSSSFTCIHSPLFLQCVVSCSDVPISNYILLPLTGLQGSKRNEIPQTSPKKVMLQIGFIQSQKENNLKKSQAIAARRSQILVP